MGLHKNMILFKYPKKNSSSHSLAHIQIKCPLPGEIPQGHFTGNCFLLFIMYLFLKGAASNSGEWPSLLTTSNTTSISSGQPKASDFNKPARRIPWQVFAHVERFRSHAFGVSSSEKGRCWLQGNEGAGDCRWLRNTLHSSSVSHTSTDRGSEWYWPHLEVRQVEIITTFESLLNLPHGEAGSP